MNYDELQQCIKQFRYYKSLGDKSIAQTSDKDLFTKLVADSNDIATIIKHLWGNMLSRWTNFLHSDGEKAWRKRDEEFICEWQTREEVLEKWEEAWATLFDSLEKLQPTDLDRIIYIRKEGHTVSEAIYRQLSHYPYHIGQMVFLAKLFQKEAWQSLSIPKGGSKAYNAIKNKQTNQRKHFTEDPLNEQHSQ